MKRQKPKFPYRKKILGSIVFLILVIIQTSPGTAVSIWSEDFEDGNYDGWTILDGSYSATTGRLTASGEKTAHHRIKHESNTAYGTWSFDVYVNQSNLISGEHMYIYFCTETLGNLGEEKGYFLTLIPDSSWMIDPSSIILGSRTGVPSVTLGEWAETGKLAEYLHIDVTRDKNGHFNVYVDGNLIIEAMDNEHTIGNYFGFDSTGGHGLDNITVNDEMILYPQSLERANLQFTEKRIIKEVGKEEIVTVTVVVKNEGEATGYGMVVIGTSPSGITVAPFGSSLVKNLIAGDTRDMPLKITTEASVKSGKYNVSIQLKNTTTVLDTFTLTIEIPGNGIGIPGFEMMSVSLIISTLALFSRKKKYRSTQR